MKSEFIICYIITVVIIVLLQAFLIHHNVERAPALRCNGSPLSC